MALSHGNTEGLRNRRQSSRFAPRHPDALRSLLLTFPRRHFSVEQPPLSHTGAVQVRDTMLFKSSDIRQISVRSLDGN